MKGQTHRGECLSQVTAAGEERVQVRERMKFSNRELDGLLVSQGPEPSGKSGSLPQIRDQGDHGAVSKKKEKCLMSRKK